MPLRLCSGSYRALIDSADRFTIDATRSKAGAFAMPAVTPQGLRADFAAKLSQLETGAAVLERDARNEHAGLIERGFDFPLAKPRFSGWQAAQSGLLGSLAGAAQTAAAPIRWARQAAPYIAAALRIVRRCLIDGAICIAAALAALIPFALAIIVLAPPV
jgi:hypothetical protein